MKKLISLLFVAGLCLFAEDAKVAGAWQMSVEMGQGSGKGDLTVEQTGTTLKGALEVENMGKIPMTGSVEGKTVTMKLDLHGGQMSITLTGKVDGAKMSGTIAPEGTWSAVRPKGSL